LSIDQYYAYISNSHYKTHVYVNCSGTPNIETIQQIDGETEIIHLRHPSGCPSKTSFQQEFTRNYIDENDIINVPSLLFDFKQIHPDTQKQIEPDFGIIKKKLDSSGIPIYDNNGYHKTITSIDSFYSWFHHVPCDSVHNSSCNDLIKLHKSFILKKYRNNVWMHHNETFFPIDNSGFGNEKMNHNYGFTMMIEFDVINVDRDLKFSLSSDDDSWLFVNGSLIIDNGGIHATLGDTVTISTPYIGSIHHVSLFYAERHVTDAVLSLTIYGNVLQHDYNTSEQSSSNIESSEQSATIVESSDHENSDHENSDHENSDHENSDHENSEQSESNIESSDYENSEQSESNVESSDHENSEQSESNVESSDHENSEQSESNIESSDHDEPEYESSDYENSEQSESNVESSDHDEPEYESSVHENSEQSESNVESSDHDKPEQSESNVESSDHDKPEQSESNVESSDHENSEQSESNVESSDHDEPEYESSNHESSDHENSEQSESNVESSDHEKSEQSESNVESSDHDEPEQSESNVER
jgi:fibro-slime domain-containing protein